MRIKSFGVALSLVAGALLVRTAAQTRPAVGQKVNPQNLISGSAAFLDYRGIKPGTFRKIAPADLPRPFATDSARNSGMSCRALRMRGRRHGGLQGRLVRVDLRGPRQLRFAPNGDAFVVESRCRADEGVARPQRRREAAAGIGFRHRPEAAIWSRFLSAGRQPAMAVRRQHERDCAVRVQERRPES